MAGSRLRRLCKDDARSGVRCRWAIAVAALTIATMATGASSASASASAGVVGWGNLPEPVQGLSGVVEVSATFHEDAALLSDGTVVEWSPGTDQAPTPVSGLSEVTAISVAPELLLALLRDGKVIAQGTNEDGELGDGSTEESEALVEIPGLSEVIAISAGDEHALALLRDGTVRAWGRNVNGELGDGSFAGPEMCGFEACSRTPVAVNGLSGVTAIDAGTTHDLALLGDGTVMAWGDNEVGELGDGEPSQAPGGGVSQDEPVPVKELSDVTAISAGERESLALLADGTVRAWGEDQFGQLGDGKSTYLEGGVNYPVSVSDLSEAIAISAGGPHNMALLRDGTVVDWGLSGRGEVGEGPGELGTGVSGPEFCVQQFGEPEEAGYGWPCSKVPREVSELTGVSSISESEGGVEALAAGPLSPRVTGVTPDYGAGAGGTEVTITGTDLAGATQVRFDGADAPSFAVDSQTSITAIAPAGTGAVDVTVVTPEGTTPTNSRDRFSYAATVTAVTPDYGPVAGGTAVTITGTDFTEVSAVRFGSADAPSFTVDSPTSITAESPPGTGVQDVTVLTTGGTSATGAQDRFSYVAFPIITSVEPSRGHDGTEVVIEGNNLSGATAVTFGSTAATTFDERNPGQIHAVAPANGVGVVDVRVTTSGGTSETAPADKFTYVSRPVISGVSPDVGPGQGGTTVTITGANLEETTAVEFGSTPAASYTVDSATSVTAVSPAGTGTVDVTATTAGGTSATSRADEFSYLTPTVTKLSPKKGAAAGGTPVVIDGTNFTGATSVEFGTTSALEFTVNSPTSIAAVSPPGLGSVNVIVTTPDGVSAASKKDEFKYGSPTVTSVSPDAGPTAGGTSVTVTGSGFAPGTTATTFEFGKALATEVSCSSTSMCVVVSPAAAKGKTGVVDVRALVSKKASAKNPPGDQFSYD